MEITDRMQPDIAYSVHNLAKLTGHTEGMVKSELKSALYGGDVEKCSIANAKGVFWRLKRTRQH